jgi:hypothetical protein
VIAKRTLNDQQLLKLLIDSPWERALRDSRRSPSPEHALRSWLCDKLVARGEPRRSREPRRIDRAA